MESTRVAFPGSDGHSLRGRWHAPGDAARGVVLFAHCFTCSKDLGIASRMARTFADRGFGVLRFDFTGLGESDGDFADTSFSSNLDDLVAAAEYLRQTHAAPQLLVGHSLGGAAVLAAAHRIPEVAAIATIGAPAEPEHVRKLVAAAEPDLAEAGVAEVRIAGRAFRIRQQFLDDLARHGNAEAIATLGRALLVLHSPQDLIVGVENASAIFRAARHPKSFISLDGADHLLSRPADAAYAAEAIAAWAGRYLPDADRAPAADELPAGMVETTIGDSGYAVDVRAGAHRLRADEPRTVGGGDTGPTPYDYVLAGLGACTAMTLRMYADRKTWPLSAVDVRLRHGRVHARDCEDCETSSGRVDVIDREIALSGALDADQRARLLEIADRCPVHRTLEGEIKVRTTFRD